MSEATCLIDDCDKKVASRGLCDSHYRRHRREGTIDEVALPPFGTAVRGVVTNVDIEAKTCDCSIHGPGVRLRVRMREGRKTPYLACRICDRKRSSGRRGSSRARSASNRWQKYGLADAELQIRLAAQGGKCLICRINLDGKFVVDHCHEVGHVRGILCRACNLGLGFFCDNPAALMQASKYVKRYKRPDAA